MADSPDPPEVPDVDQIPDMNALLAQAQRMQEQLLAAQEAAADQRVDGQAGGGAVRVEVTGSGEFLAVRIERVAVDPDDVEMLEDLVLAAIHDAMAKVADLSRQASRQAMGGLDLGGITGGLGGVLG